MLYTFMFFQGAIFAPSALKVNETFFVEDIAGRQESAYRYQTDASQLCCPVQKIDA